MLVSQCDKFYAGTTGHNIIVRPTVLMLFYYRVHGPKVSLYQESSLNRKASFFINFEYKISTKICLYI